MPALDLGSQSAPGWHPHQGVARLVNMYVEQAGPEGKAQLPLRAVAGLTDFATLTGGGATRAMLSLDSEVLAVSNRVLFRVDAGGTPTVVGGIASDGHVTMARNGRQSGTQVGIVCDGLYYIYSGGTLTQVNDADLQPPNSICYVGGYFVLTCPSGRVYVTELEEGDAIDALDFNTAQRNPDGLLVGKPRGNEVVLFGPRSTEIWQLSGDGDFPFIPAHTLNVGAYAASAVTEASIITRDLVADTIIWAATDREGKYAGVCMLNGFNAPKISSLAVDRAIQGESDPNVITATSWVESGHAFVSFSGSDWTWVYDTASGQWHERASAGTRWRIAHCATLGTRTIAGDATEAFLYVIDPDATDEADEELVCTIQTPPVVSYPGRIEMDELWLDVIPGVGTGTGADEDVTPQVAMQWSADGTTWSTELHRSMGVQGATGTRVRWTRLGTQGSHGRTYRFRSSASVVRGVLQAHWNGKVIAP